LNDEQKTKILAARLYDGYCQYTGFKSLVTGDDLPVWEELPPYIQDAWRMSAKVVINEIIKKDMACIRILNSVTDMVPKELLTRLESMHAEDLKICGVN
jgi:hypothetical protein